MDRKKGSGSKGLGDVPVGRIRPLNDKEKKITPVSIILKVVLGIVIFTFMLIFMAGSALAGLLGGSVYGLIRSTPLL